MKVFSVITGFLLFVTIGITLTITVRSQTLQTTRHLYAAVISPSGRQTQTVLAFSDHTLNSQTIRVRKSIYALTPVELQHFVNALNTLRSNGHYQEFMRRHISAMMTKTPAGDPDRNVAHQGPSFLPWHREFIYEFEDLLRSVDPEMTLPYWPFEQEPAGKIPRILTSGYFGGDGDPARNNQITDGPFASWDIIRKIARDPNTNQTTLPTRQEVTRLLQYTFYETPPYTGSSDGFNMAMEGWVGNKAPWNMHNQVHGYIGGDMGGDKDGRMLGMNAANDPLFFVVHANVDRIWWQWQQQHGITNYQPVSGGPAGHNLNDTMQFLLKPTKPSDVLDITKLYYRYE